MRGDNASAGLFCQQRNDKYGYYHVLGKYHRLKEENHIFVKTWKAKGDRIVWISSTWCHWRHVRIELSRWEREVFSSPFLIASVIWPIWNINNTALVKALCTLQLLQIWITWVDAIEINFDVFYLNAPSDWFQKRRFSDWC